MRTQRPAPLVPGLYPNALHADGLQPGQFPTLNDRLGVGAQQAEDVVARLAAESFDHDRHSEADTVRWYSYSWPDGWVA